MINEINKAATPNINYKTKIGNFTQTPYQHVQIQKKVSYTLPQNKIMTVDKSKSSKDFSPFESFLMSLLQKQNGD